MSFELVSQSVGNPIVIRGERIFMLVDIELTTS